MTNWQHWYQPRFPYEQQALQRHQRTTAALLLGNRRQVDLDVDELTADSPIVVVSESVGTALIARYKEDPEALRTIDRREFEEFVAELFDGFGFAVDLTQQTRDGGKDIIAVSSQHDIEQKYLIEAKRPDPGNVVGIGVVRQLYAVLTDDQATKGILVTTTHFSREAKAFAERHRWELDLKDFEGLQSWLEEYCRIKGL